MSAEIKRFKYGYRDDGYGQRILGLILDDAGSVVLHSDHLASHAYDEAVERAAFEAAMLEEGFRATLEPDLDGVYMSPATHAMWCGWLRCAKSRAKRFGGAE